MVRGACLAVLAALCAGASARAQAPAADPSPLQISSQRGHISLWRFAPPGARVTFSERVGNVLEPIRDVTVDPAPNPISAAGLVDAITWRCDRLARRFVADAVAPDGSRTSATVGTRTPSCRDRLEVVVPRKVARGGLLTVQVSDRFGLGGFHARVCAASTPATGGPAPAAAAPTRCRLVLLPAAGARSVRFRAGGDAVWRIRARGSGSVVERVLVVGAARRPADAAGLPRLLVAGDSLIQGVDAFLADRLQTAFDVTSDTRAGTGLVKETAVDWLALGRKHARTLKPAVTVLSLGDNDGVPIEGEQCCSVAWSAAYAERARTLMRTYARGARGRVLWMIAPRPRDPRFAAIAAAVAAGVRQAAVGEKRVTLVPLDELLTPGGRYRDAIDIDGRSVRVRADDGVHLSLAGERYVAGVIVDVLRTFRATG